MDDTIGLVYLEDEDEEEATRRVRVVFDYDYNPASCVGGGMATLNYITWREQIQFLRGLNYQDEEYTEEVLSTGGIIFDGKQYWTEGPSDQDGQCYFAFDTRKIAKEYKQDAYDDMRLYFDRGAVGFIYEVRCNCCKGWHVEDSLWGIVGWDEKYAREYLLEHDPAGV